MHVKNSYWVNIIFLCLWLPESFSTNVLNLYCNSTQIKLHHIYVLCRRWLLCWRQLVEQCFQMEGNHWSMGREAWALWRCLELLDRWWPWLLWVSPGKCLLMQSDFASFDFCMICHILICLLWIVHKARKRLGRSSNLGLQCW